MKKNHDSRLEIYAFRLLTLRIVSFLYVLLFVFPLWGQKGIQNPFAFKQFIDGNSTTSNVVNCFLEDRDGFLWIGTADGLKRFDGKNFTLFKHDKNRANSLIHNEIESLCEDNFGRIWVGTGEGISYFDKKTNQFFNFKEFNKINTICLNILCDSDNNIWFSIRGIGLYRYSEKTKKFESFTNNTGSKTSVSNSRIYQKGMIIDAQKRGIWLQTRKGINYFEFSTNQFFNKKNNPDNLPIFESENTSGLALDGKHLIFFDKDSQKIKYYDIEKKQISNEIKVAKSLSNETISILYIFVDKNHNLWLSDWFTYCYYLDTKTNKLTELIYDVSNPNSIASNTFWCTYQQKDGMIWLGTNNGICYTNPQKNFYQIYNLSHLYTPLKEKSALYYFKEDATDSTWWLAADQQNLLHYAQKTNQLETINLFKRIRFPEQSILTITENQHNVYVVSTCAFHIFDKKKKSVKELFLPDSLNQKNIISHATAIGDSILFFCNNSKVYSYKISTKKWTSYPILTKLVSFTMSSYPFILDDSRSIRCSVVDDNGDIWISIQNIGLAKFSKQKQAFELIKAPKEIDFKKVSFTSMRKDATGNLWIGANDLIKFNPNTYEFQVEADINIINDLLIDKVGGIWSSAHNDFTVFYPKTQKTLSITIPINRGNLEWINNLFLLKNGQIISLMKGIIAVIDPKKIKSSSTKDKVLISKIAVAGSEILLHNSGSSVILEASENDFNVYFSKLSPLPRSNYTYKYQLSGYQNGWIATSDNFTSYTNLDGGDYVFMVKGIDENGIETPIEELKIHIDTLLYKTWWFLLIVGLIAAYLVYGFLRFRANQRSKIYQLQMQSTRLEKDKTEIQYQNLINHLNPHFLFNSLTSLNGLILSEPDIASDFLQKLSKIYRYILQNKDNEVVSLEQELTFVQNYIDLQKSRFEDGLHVNIAIDDDYLSSKIVPVTLQNLFENAIKHNTVEEDKPLIINVFVEDKYLIVKNNLQKKKFVETSNKQGIESLKKLYSYLTDKPFETIETENEFIVKVPLL